VLSAIPKDKALFVPLALILTVDPLTDVAPVVFPAVKVEAAPDERVVLPLEVKLVNLPLDWISVPIAVLLIPVPVTLKLLAVTVRLLVPDKIMLDAPSPDKDNAPDVPVILTDVPVTLTAPVSVNPALAVKSPEEVMVAELLVEIFPDAVILPAVVSTPVSSIVSLAVPPLE
jgi:hypothetical protein